MADSTDHAIVHHWVSKLARRGLWTIDHVVTHSTSQGWLTESKAHKINAPSSIQFVACLQAQPHLMDYGLSRSRIWKPESAAPRPSCLGNQGYRVGLPRGEGPSIASDSNPRGKQIPVLPPPLGVQAYGALNHFTPPNGGGGPSGPSI